MIKIPRFAGSMGNESACCGCEEQRPTADTAYSNDPSNSSDTAEKREVPLEGLDDADSADRAIDEAQNAKREAAMLVCCL